MERDQVETLQRRRSPICFTGRGGEVWEYWVVRLSQKVDLGQSQVDLDLRPSQGGFGPTFPLPVKGSFEPP